MRKTLVLTALFAILLPLTALSAEDKETLGIYEKATVSYQDGDYEECIEKFEKLLNELKITTIEKIIAAHCMLGASYYFEDDQERSKDHFKTLLNFNSDFELSVYDYPPKVIEFFNEIKRVKKLEEAAGRTNISSQTTAVEPLKQDISAPKITEERVFDQETADPMKRNPYGNNLIPFGTAQFKNNEPEKGWFFLSSQALTLAGTVSTAIAFKSLQRSDGSFDNPTTGRGLKNGFYTSLILYLTITLTGIADACLNYNEFPYAQNKALPISFSVAPNDKNGMDFLIGFKN